MGGKIETESVRKTERAREMVDDTQIGWTWNRVFLHRCLDVIIALHSPPPFEVQSQWYNVVTKSSPDYKLLIKRIHLLHGTSGHHSSYLSTVGYHIVCPLIARFMGPTWGPTGADRTQVGPCWPHESFYMGKLFSTLETTRHFSKSRQPLIDLENFNHLRNLNADEW